MIKGYIGTYLISVLIASYSQILLKISAGKTYKKNIYEWLNPIVIAAYSIFFLSMVLTNYALRGIEYKYSAIIESLGYLFILILSRSILKERMSKKKVIGNLIIIVGIIIYTL